eukprot:m.134639 g.134639  ORF g.134639 m.134639 type:complete len:187 (+) comp16543_c0_seq3:78-638(+)
MNESCRTLFPQGVAAALKRWETLQTAVHQGWGGEDSKEKAEWMVTVIVDLFHQKKPSDMVDKVELEDYIDDIMKNEFDALPDDSDLAFIATRIIRMWRDCVKEDTAGLTEFLKKSYTFVPKDVSEGEDSSSDDDGADGNDEDDSEGAMQGLQRGAAAVSLQDEPEPQPEVDPDGWETVKPKGRKGR